MASASSIDVDATQRLRDMLKLDRPVDALNENQLKLSSFNGDMNGFVASDKVDSGNAATVDGKLLEPSLPVPSTSMARLTDKQLICLSGDDSSTFIEIVARNVEIVASNDSNICSEARGSSKVKIQPVAKYDWEQKYYYGNLIAVSNAYLAYAIRGSNGSAMIRVLSVTTAERILLKGITGSVTDLAFAHLNSNQLACLDEAGSLFVWKLTMEDGKIQEEIIVHIRRQDHTQLNTHRRIIWCPYIPEDNEDVPAEDASQNLALLHEDRAEVWDLEIVRANHTSWPTDVSDIKEGFIVVKGHCARLSEGALSPDGTVLATASHDGFVKFWQIYIEGQDQPRCLHEWKPHGGRPVSCLLFCDNHKKQDPDVPFWRFLITGADKNRELKMWCTVSWTCLQTIRFSADPFNTSVVPGLKVSLDLAAEYLILTDVQRKVLYVMELEQDQEEGRAAFTSISEFLLTHPVLSFGIQDVSRCRIRHTEVLPSEIENDNIGVEETLEADEAEGEDEGAPAVLIKLYCVHTKALQDVQIKFKPHQKQKSIATPLKDTRDFFSKKDKVVDMTPEKLQVAQSLHGSQNDLLRSTTDFLLLPNDPKPKLMTPDAFMVPSIPIQQITSSPGTSISSLTTVTPLSSASSSDTIVSRIPDEITLSPKLQLDNSITLSSSQHSGSFPSSPRTSAVLIPGLSDKMTPKPVVQVTPSNISLELQSLEPSVVSQASPTRERSPDVISSASTTMSQDIPEIASETLQRSYPAPLSLGLSSEDVDTSHAPSMSSAASALHLLSALNCSKLELGHRPLEPGPAVPEGELINTQSLDEPSSQDKVDEMISQPWPAAPDITRETRNRIAESDHDDEVASLANSLSGFVAKGQSPRLLTKDWTSMSPNSSPKSSRKSMKDNKHTTLPKASMHQTSMEQHGELMALLYSQQRELSELRQNQLELMQRLTNHLEAAQSSIMGHVERVIDTQQEQEKRRLDRILSDEQQRNGQLQDYLSQQLSHSLSGSLSNRLDKTIREEIKKTVPLCITKTLEPVTGQLSNTIAAKLASVESTLKDSVTKMVKSKNVTDAIGRGVADSLQISIQTGYRESFQSIVLPAFEKGCQSMFHQINHSFQQGTQEYMHQLESHLKNKKANEQETWEPLLTQLQQLVDTLQTTTDQLSSNLSSSVRSEVQHQIHLAVGNMQESILSNIQRIIKEEVHFALKEQHATVTSSIMQAMRSAAGTPVQSSHFDFHASARELVLQMLQQGNINQAFQQALTASDLNLILYVCESVDIQQVFGQQPCPLTQPVLLSLIQQLSFDLGIKTELKISYLEEAVMHLDHTDPVTRDHMGAVMNQVRKKLLQFLQGETHSPSQKPARRLMIMLQGLATPNIS